MLILILIGISSVIKPEEINITFNRDYYPFEFINDDGIPDGFAIDLIFAIARESALTVNLIEGNWKFRDDEIFSGEIDLSPGYLSKSLNSSVIYSKTLFTVPFTLMYNKEINITDSLSIKNKTLVLSSGDSSEPFLEKENNSGKIIRTKNWSDSFKALSVGYGDYLIVSTVHAELIDETLKRDLTALKNFTLEIPYGFYAAEWNNYTLEKINNSISIIKASGEYDRIYRKWFRDSENSVIKRSESNQGISMYITIAVLLFISFIVYKNMRKVKK